MSGIPVTPADTINLASILRKLVERASDRATLTVADDVVTAVQMVDYLRQRVEIEDAPISLA